MNRGCENTMTTKQVKVERVAARQKAPPDKIKKREWLAIRKKAGRKIDAETAEVRWDYGQTLDPYGIDPELPEECQQIGRNYFARWPGSDIWVCFCDLPKATREALWGPYFKRWEKECLRRDRRLPVLRFFFGPKMTAKTLQQIAVVCAERARTKDCAP